MRNLQRPRPALRRSLNLPLLVLYGLGTTIGAGIYALIGEIAGVAGYLAAWSFLVASALAAFTALSFAELSARYPKAAGAALYVQNGFASHRVALLVGLLVALSGIVSSAALLNGFVGYVNEFVEVDRVLLICLTVTVLGLVAAWGIAESVTIAAIVSVVEIGGLVWVISLAGGSIDAGEIPWEQMLPNASLSSWAPIFTGAILAFYAFIGFEDMVEVAEEVRRVKRTLPYAIILTLIISTAIYLLLIFAATVAMTPAALAESDAPLAALYEQLTGEKPIVITAIGLFAIINGALIQIIMASRVLYGLASRNQLPTMFATVNEKTRTPLVATVTIALLILAFALMGNLSSLAHATATVMLAIFATVNLALWRIKAATPRPPDVLVFPRWISLLGFLVSTAFVVVAVVS
jgi:APA family basic amino acid/polyamine antiporter